MCILFFGGKNLYIFLMKMGDVWIAPNFVGIFGFCKSSFSLDFQGKDPKKVEKLSNFKRNFPPLPKPPTKCNEEPKKPPSIRMRNAPKKQHKKALISCILNKFIRFFFNIYLLPKMLPHSPQNK